MEENIVRAFKNLAGYTIKATEKAILELSESILDKRNESVKSHLEQRQKTSQLPCSIWVLYQFVES